MAITYSKLPSGVELLNAYNNNILEFVSDESAVPLYCALNISGKTYRISPNLNGVFRFNLKDSFKVVLNLDNFIDTATLPLIPGDVNTIVEEDTLNAYKSISVNIEIFFDTGITNKAVKLFKVLRSVENIKNYSSRVMDTSANDLFFLSPFEDVEDRTIKLSYWFGYPFDISYFINADETRKVLLLSSLLPLAPEVSINVDFKANVGRFIVSNVVTEITAHLPIKTGINYLKISPIVTSPEEDIYIHLTKKVNCRGIYIKYLNQYGKWNYHLFNQRSRSEFRTRSQKEIFNDFEDLDENQSLVLQSGKRSTEVVRAHSRGVTSDEMLVLKGLFESPKIYIYLGGPAGFASVYSLSDWVEIKLNDGGYIVDDYKKNTFNVNCVFQYPERNTLKQW